MEKMRSDKNILVGDNVEIRTKTGEVEKGMVRSILREEKERTLVELLNGKIGVVQRKIVKGTRTLTLTPIKKIARLRPTTKKVTIETLLKEETSQIEHKTSALWSQNLNKEELEKKGTQETRQYGNKASKIIIAKTITGFLNTEGGHLIIGIQEKKKQEETNKIIGIENELKKLKNKDYGEDGYKRMILDDIIKPYLPKTIFNHLNKYMKITFHKKEGKTLCIISVKKSDHEIFLTVQNKDHFYIRVDTQTRELQGKQIIDYVRTHWK